MSTFDGAGKGMPAFVPAPARIEASFGTLEFAGGGFPDEATTRRLYNELDLQRATQAYLDFYPALSLHGILTAQVRDYGVRSSSDIVIFADFADAAGPKSTMNLMYASFANPSIPAGISITVGPSAFRSIVKRAYTLVVFAVSHCPAASAKSAMITMSELLRTP